METIKIVLLIGCDKCGDSEYLQPFECLCDKCLVKSIKKDLLELENQNYMSAEFASHLKDKSQNRLNEILQRQGWQA
ncbi:MULTISPECIES: hypothetical protein [Nodularia]|uniref:hypothetical protein n=1 Tax=Nodularia TaxID=159191 RepID=UPI001D0FCCE6|nr:MULTISPECIES: hypothetical protein [Nodularia]MCC2692845.1 hypothetical protein [Nodularia sp. LEGE 04288]MDB9369185.1 hypothetical protein [Nodularia spumigena CS-586/05]